MSGADSGVASAAQLLALAMESAGGFEFAEVTGIGDESASYRIAGHCAPLGGGAFGAVYRGTDGATGAQVGIKRFACNATELSRIGVAAAAAHAVPAMTPVPLVAIAAFGVAVSFGPPSVLQRTPLHRRRRRRSRGSG